MKADLFLPAFRAELDYYLSLAEPCRRAVKTASADDPAIRDAWLDPGRRRVIVRRTHTSPYGEKIAGYPTLYVSFDRIMPEPTWCCLALTRGKTAALTENLQGALGWNDKYYPPSPLAAMLAGGVLGAGLGYGGSAILSRFLPDDWDKKKFRRSGLLLGTGLGMAPGTLETAKSLLIGQPVLDGSHLRLNKRENEPAPKTGNWLDRGLPHAPNYSTGPKIDAEAMLNTVWRSPMVSGRLTPKEQSLFSGAMIGSQRIAQKPFVTPADMARLTAGMGIGYASGLVAGKVLGTLSGMPPSAQKTLAHAGMYAGVVKSVLPMIYGMR